MNKQNQEMTFSNIKSLFFKFFIIVAIILALIYANNLHIKYNPQIKSLITFYQINSTITDFEKISSGKYNIIYVETNKDREFLSARQLCSIESTAMHNPRANVNVFSVNAKFPDSNDLSKTYKNIHLIKFSLDAAFQDTPLADWWKRGEVFKSPYVYVHMSDAVRLALVWKYGGVYLDLDFLTLKSFENLIRYGNGFGYLFEGYDSANNAFLVFKANHPYLHHAMTYLANNYQPYDWASNGPVLILNTIKTFCDIPSLPFKNLQTACEPTIFGKSGDKCDDILFYPEKYLYPLRYQESEFSDYFKKSEKSLSSLVTTLATTYSIHLFNAISSKFSININEDSVFRNLTKQNCFITYKSALNNTIQF